MLYIVIVTFPPHLSPSSPSSLSKKHRWNADVRAFDPFELSTVAVISSTECSFVAELEQANVARRPSWSVCKLGVWEGAGGW